MKKIYNIEVDCANCANKMEKAACQVAGVASCTISFMTQRIHVEFEEGADPKTVMAAVLKACRKVDGDCTIEL